MCREMYIDNNREINKLGEINRRKYNGKTINKLIHLKINTFKINLKNKK